jgi:NAD(P)H-dependent FMN reductase
MDCELDRSPLSISQRVAIADAFVVVTPGFNHSFPAPLKLLIDSMGEPTKLFADESL